MSVAQLRISVEAEVTVPHIANKSATRSGEDSDKNVQGT